MRHAAGGSAWLTDAALAAERPGRGERAEPVVPVPPAAPAGPAVHAETASPWRPPVSAAAHRIATARPGSRRAPPGGSRRSGRAYLVVVGGVGLSLCYLWQGPQNVRAGALTVAGLLIAAAAARLVLPEQQAGMLVSRRRLADVAVFAGLGVALLITGLVFPAQS